MDMLNTKQTKIQNAIIKTGGRRPDKDKKVPRDEYRLGMNDIYKELSYWAKLNKFRGKDIICPCDWDIVKDDNIYAIEILYANGSSHELPTSVELYRCTETGEVVFEKVKEEDIEEFIYYKLHCSFLRTLTQNAYDWGIKSITASGYDPKTGKGFPYQDIDYSMYDVCITNPPTSLLSNFTNTILGKIDFIIVSPLINRTHATPIVPIMLKKAYLGKGRRVRPTFTNSELGKETICKELCCDWLVTFPEAQNEIDSTPFYTGVTYELYKNDYRILDGMTMKDGTHPIKVANCKCIPDDYYGWMKVAGGFMDFLSYEQFEWYPTSAYKYFNEINPDSNPFAHKITPSMFKVSWKKGSEWEGLIIRRKTT